MEGGRRGDIDRLQLELVLLAFHFNTKRKFVLPLEEAEDEEAEAAEEACCLCFVVAVVVVAAR